MRRACAALVAVLWLASAAAPAAVTISPEETDETQRWVLTHFGGRPEPPFTFVYDGKPSSEVLAACSFQLDTENLDAQRVQHTLRWRDAKTGLEVRCVAIEYLDFPTVEWTVFFRNASSADSPILEKILALDATWQRPPNGEFLLHHAVGSRATAEDYGPRETTLVPGASKRLAAAGGRGTGGDWSYWNVEWDKQGVICAVGWPGQWAAEFAREGPQGLRIRAGQENTRFKLLGGEEVRSPLIVVQFWKGGLVRSQNVWRRWMMAHGMPRPGGHLPPPQLLASSSRAYGEMIGANEQNQIMHLDRYAEEKLKLDSWWMDAGWYIQQKGWPQVGTWEVDPKRFPHGFRPISDHAHAQGTKILVWFEPERVAPGTWLFDMHPEWLLTNPAAKPDSPRLLNLGNPAARQWLTEHVDKLLTDEGIDLYRQDFNIEPLAFWRAADAADRQGITEIKYVAGLLAYWDELRRRHPDMLIDACASGGRRNDLETMRRAVPLWRSDYAYEPIGQQAMTYGIASWLPYYGTGTVACAKAGYYGVGRTPVEPYAFWSNATPSLGLGIDIREKEIDYKALRRLIDQWRQINACYLGDFYPLVPYSLEKKAWIAWQFDNPERWIGMVQAFRRDEAPEESIRVKLHGLEYWMRYKVTNLATGASEERDGRELVESGLTISLKERPAAAVLVYRRLW